MANALIGDIITANVPRDMLVDLADELRARTAKAHEVVSEHTDLDPRRRNRASGMLRFHLNEKGFEDITQFHGGVPLLNGVLPDIEIAVFQPYKQFGNVLLGFATATEPGCAPAKNKSRQNAAQLNFDFMDTLEVEAKRSSTLFVLLVIYRDMADPGKVAEIGVGVLASDCTHFVFYERFEGFIARYARPTEKPAVRRELDADVDGSEKLVVLKTNPRRYTPPEEPEEPSSSEDEV